MSGAVGRGDQDHVLKGKVEATKVKRYRPGQAPEWMQDKNDDDFEVPGAIKPTEPQAPRSGMW